MKNRIHRLYRLASICFFVCCFHSLSFATATAPDSIKSKSSQIFFENYTDSIIRVFDPKTGGKLRLYYSIDWPMDGPEELRNRLKRRMLKMIDPENESIIDVADNIDLPSYLRSVFEDWFKESQEEDWYDEDLRDFKSEAVFTDDEFLDYDMSAYTSLYMQNGTNPLKRVTLRIRLSDDAVFSDMVRHPFQDNSGYSISSILGGLAICDDQLAQVGINDLFEEDGVHPERFLNEQFGVMFTSEGVFFNAGMGALGYPMAAGEISFTIPYQRIIPLLSDEAKGFVPSKYIREYEENKTTIDDIENIIYSLCYDEIIHDDPYEARAQYNPLMLWRFQDKGITSGLSRDDVMSRQLKELHRQIYGVVDNYVNSHPQWFKHYQYDYPSLYFYLLRQYGCPEMNVFCVITGYNFISSDKVIVTVVTPIGPEYIEFIKEDKEWKINDVDNLQYDMRQTINDPTYWLRKNI